MIAVTGANGLLGSFIIRKLIANNESFVAIKRAHSDTSLLADVASKITWREADVLNPVELEDALQGVSKVIHAAAVISFNPRKARLVMDINVKGTRNIINECLAKGIKRFIHMSSVAALGRQKNQKLIDETNQWVSNPMNTVYAESKYLAELEVFRAQEEGMSTVILNPSVILAPGDWNKSSAQLFKYAWKEKPFYTDAFLNYVDVRDVAEITYTLLEKQLSGERFIVNAGNISFEDFFIKVAHRFDKKPPRHKLSPSLLHIAARAEEIRTRFTGDEPLLTRETARLAGTEFLYSNDKIRNVLNLEFQPIDSTLEWCCQYYLSKYMHKN